MELLSILMGVVFTALIVVPLYFLIKSGGKNKKDLLLKFKALCEKVGVQVAEQDTWNDMALGLDKNAGKVLFFKDRKGNETHTVVDLALVNSCRKVNVSRSAKTNAGVSNVIDQIGLEFAMKEGQPPVLLEFYSSTDSFILHDELLLAEKWSKLIGDLLKKQSLEKKAA